MISTYVDLGTEELKVTDKRKVVIRKTIYGGREKIDLRFWNYYKDKWIPLKGQGLFFDAEVLKALVPLIEKVCSR